MSATPEHPPGELPLTAPPEILAQLVDMLPLHIVRVRRFGIMSPHVHSLAVAVLAQALAQGSPIDRSNGEGPIAEWDGWLVIETPGGRVEVETRHAKPRQ